MKIVLHDEEETVPLECLRAGAVFQYRGSIYVLTAFRPLDDRGWKVMRAFDGELIDMLSSVQVHHKPNAVLYSEGDPLANS